MSVVHEKNPDVQVQLEAALRENSRYQDQIYFLTEMGSLLGQQEIALLLVKILQLTTEFIGADVGSIVLLDAAGTPRTAVDWGLPHAAVLDLKRRDGAGLLDLALESGQPQVFHRSELQPVLDGAYDVEKVLLLPLNADGRVLGSIVMVLPESDDAHTIAQLEMAAPAVGLASIALENTQLTRIKLDRVRDQHQLKLAQEIQRRLLPAKAPVVAGLELAAVYIPAAAIGGDYYDYLHLSDGSLGIVIADVSGKDVPAGLVMTAVRAMFRTAARVTFRPGQILQQVNEQLCLEHLDGMFVTAACMRIDGASGQLTLAVAGHDPLLLVHGGGVELAGNRIHNLPLGVLEGREYEEEAHELRPGEAFVLYTDGVTEARNEFGRQFGSRHLRDIAAQCPGLDAKNIVLKILAALEAHIGKTPRHDDIAVLVGRRSPD